MTTIVIDCPVRSGIELHEGHAAAQAALRASSYAALRRVCCCVRDGRIVLCGTVPSYYLKQMAQCLLLRRLGAEFQLDNHLQVAIDRIDSEIA